MENSNNINANANEINKQDNTTKDCLIPDYDAFISYRHLPLDMFVAKTIHTALETFTLPKNLREQCQKTKISRIFRDQDELPLSSDLSKPIQEALSASNYLIVICTPKLKESEWCKKEIDTFKKMYGNSKILAVLAEGEPEESFPLELLTEEYSETDENGNIIIKTRNVEPLAADVRGKSNHQIKKKIKSESLRLLAPMFGLSFDALKQRHRERKIKRIALISSIISVFLLIFGIVSASMAITINEQSKIVKAGYSKSLAEDAISAYKTGDVVSAANLVDKALKLQDNANVRAAENRISGNFAPEGMLIPQKSINLDTGITSMVLSNDEKHLAVLDLLGRLNIIDTSTYELLDSKCLTLVSAFGNTNPVFLDDSRLMFSRDGLPIVYDLTKDELTTIAYTPDEVFFDKNTSVLYQASNGVLYTYDATTYECLANTPLTDNKGGTLLTAIKLCVTNDGEYTLVLGPIESDYRSPYCIVENRTGKLVTDICMLDGLAIDVTASDMNFYVNLTHMNDNNPRTRSNVVNINLDGDVQWETEETNMMNQGVTYSEDSFAKILYTFNPAGPQSIDANTGKMLFSPEISGMVVSSNESETSGIYSFCTDSGNVLSYNSFTGEVNTKHCFTEKPLLNVSNALITSNRLYVNYQGADYITAYEPLHHENARIADNEVLEDENLCIFSNLMPASQLTFYNDNFILPKGYENMTCYCSRDNSLLACFDYVNPEVHVFKADNTPGNKEDCVISVGTIATNSSFLSNVFFSEDNKYVCVSYQNGKLSVYNTNDLSLINEIKDNYSYVNCMSPMKNGGYILDSMYKTCIFDDSFNVLWDIDKNENTNIIGYNYATDELVSGSTGEIYIY